MANLRDISRRMSSIKSTMQVTRTMEMISTARIRRALDRAEAIGEGKPILVMMHFPPRLRDDAETPFTRILEARERVKAVVYGHLHGEAFAAGFSGESQGIRYYPVSCDGIGFRPFCYKLSDR